MDLKTYLAEMSPEAREAFAVTCGTTAGHMRNVMYCQKTCATDLAVQIERHSGKKVMRQELRSDWADHWPELTALPDPAPADTADPKPMSKFAEQGAT